VQLCLVEYLVVQFRKFENSRRHDTFATLKSIGNLDIGALANSQRDRFLMRLIFASTTMTEVFPLAVILLRTESPALSWISRWPRPQRHPGFNLLSDFRLNPNFNGRAGVHGGMILWIVPIGCGVGTGHDQIRREPSRSTEASCGETWPRDTRECPSPSSAACHCCPRRENGAVRDDAVDWARNLA
jgi:hypothetical protein